MPPLVLVRGCILTVVKITTKYFGTTLTWESYQQHSTSGKKEALTPALRAKLVNIKQRTRVTLVTKNTAGREECSKERINGKREKNVKFNDKNTNTIIYNNKYIISISVYKTTLT